MDDFKLEHFAATHPGESFPWFRTLGASESRGLLERLASRLDVEAEGPALTQAIFARAQLLSEFDAKDDAFRLDDVFEATGIVPAPHVFVNWRWYGVDQIDQFLFEDLNTYFDDVWYAGPDDIDILDKTCDWVVSVNHEGDINVLKLV